MVDLKINVRIYIILGTVFHVQFRTKTTLWRSGSGSGVHNYFLEVVGHGRQKM